MRKLIGSYSVFEFIVSGVMFSGLCYLNYLFISTFIAGETLTEQIIFMLVFMEIVGLVIVALPYITKKAEGISNVQLKEFLDLPEKDSKFSFTTVSGFLSDQALAAFLASVLIFTGKQALEQYGGAITAFYTAFLFFVAILLGSVSLIRFIFHFTKYHWFYYALAASMSTAVMFAFFNVGLKMAA